MRLIFKTLSMRKKRVRGLLLLVSSLSSAGHVSEEVHGSPIEADETCEK